MNGATGNPADDLRHAKRLDISRLWFVISVALVIFAYGIAVGRYEIFPFSAIKFVQDSIEQVFEERETIAQIRPVEHLFEARDNDAGALTIDERQMSPGLTLIAGFFEDDLEIRLIRPDGSTVNRWEVRFHEIFPDPSHIKPEDQIPETNWNTGIHGVLAFPDGSVLFNFEEKGLARLNRCGTTQWTLPQMTHHSINWSHDGGLWIPSMRFVNGASRFPELTPPYVEDTILKISQDGKILMEVSVLDLLFENDLRALLFANGPYGIGLGDATDITHLNSVEELSPELAPHFPQFAAGDLLISLRNLNLILVADPMAKKIKWHQMGPWMDQHTPHFLASGKISVFSNNNDGTADGSRLGGSTIIEGDPVSGKSSVRFGGSARQRMYTKYRGSHQILENGNTLITESNAGRAFEINKAGDVIWKYTNRFDDTNVAVISDAIRYPPGYFRVKDWTCP